MTLKLLLFVLVLGILVWMILGRRGKPPEAPPADPGKPQATKKTAEPQRMLVCAHCGIHLPQAEVRMDAVGRPFCSDEHRLLGPR